MAATQSFKAFRLSAQMPDDRIPGGVREVFWLALVRDARRAETSLRKIIGNDWNITLVGGGTGVLAEARERGMRNGELSEVTLGKARQSTTSC